MTVKLLLQLAVLIGALFMGARAGGVAMGLWGAVGLLVLVVGFGVPPGAIPGEVLMIVQTVIMAASAMGVAGVRCSRTGSGIVDRNVEVHDDKLGLTAGMELSAHEARILLMLGLTKTSDVPKLQQFFYEY